MDIKVINGVLCWKSRYQNDFTPFTRQGLTMLVKAYEAEIQQGIDIWKAIKEQQDLEIKDLEKIESLASELTIWIEALKESFPIAKSLQHSDDFSLNFDKIQLN
jgi:hypothetical protein